MASSRGFGVSVEFQLADLGVFQGFPDLDPSSHFRPAGQQVYLGKDGISQHRDTESEFSSLSDLFNLDKSQFIHYDQEKRRGKPGADNTERVATEKSEAERLAKEKVEAGVNRRRCMIYRSERKKIIQQDENELQELEDKNASLRKLQEDLARSVELTKDRYLKCILSGKMSFSSG